jgi:hypothetical protein
MFWFGESKKYHFCIFVISKNIESITEKQTIFTSFIPGAGVYQLDHFVKKCAMGNRAESNVNQWKLCALQLSKAGVSLDNGT